MLKSKLTFFKVSKNLDRVEKKNWKNGQSRRFETLLKNAEKKENSFRMINL